MEKIKRFINKKTIKYLLLFSFFLLSLLLFCYNSADVTWNYGMAHAIRIGEIPYKDFNIITTPLYPFIMSIGLFIKDSYLMYLIEQSLLCILFMYLLEKLLDKKYIILLPVICLLNFVFIHPNYNFLVIILFLLLLLFEKDKKEDWQIGILLGLLFLTKHTIGGVVIFLSILSTLDIKRGAKRLLFTCIPIFIFTLYLLITNSLTSFINLSIMGLFDFGSNNKSVGIFYIIISLLILIYTIYSFIKYKKEINNFYLLGAISLIIPLVDGMHTMYYLVLFLIIFLNRVEIKYEFKQLLLSSLLLTVVIFTLSIFMNLNHFKNIELNNKQDRMHYLLLDKEENEYVHDLLNKYNSYSNSHMISMNNMYFDLESNKKIDYFDIPLYGNFGYDGVNNMLKKIDKLHNHYFFITDDENGQFAKELVEHIRKKGELVENYQNYEIYLIK